MKKTRLHKKGFNGLDYFNGHIDLTRVHENCKRTSEFFWMVFIQFPLKISKMLLWVFCLVVFKKSLVSATSMHIFALKHSRDWNAMFQSDDITLFECLKEEEEVERSQHSISKSSFDGAINSRTERKQLTKRNRHKSVVNYHLLRFWLCFVQFFLGLESVTNGHKQYSVTYSLPRSANLFTNRNNALSFICVLVESRNVLCVYFTYGSYASVWAIAGLYCKPIYIPFDRWQHRTQFVFVSLRYSF